MIRTIKNYSFNYNKNFYDGLKLGENGFKIPISRNKYNLVRLDGASFSKQFKLRYASFARKIPYNPYLAFAMQETVLDTMKEFPFIPYAYSFSDEISILIDNSLIDFRKMNTLEKMISILSSFVSSSFNDNLRKVVNLDINMLLSSEGELDLQLYKKYEPFIKNAVYLMYVAKRNQIPLNESGINRSNEIESVNRIFKLNEVEPQEITKEFVEDAINLIKREIPFDESLNHIFYFDARLITFDSESKVYNYFKARQGFAVYKFVEDLSVSLLEKPILNPSNKTTNMYFKKLFSNKIPYRVYTSFDGAVRLGSSFYKDNNLPYKAVAKELKVEDDDKLISLISNMLEDDNSFIKVKR
ncbi:MAG: hypothetical protein IJZ29_06000 [Clostridia bacterium]|nr:hypothetical protein [Clostridia bacterium]MBQ8749998.1 hypothetical protein [Clostridia bacterium]